MEARILEDTLVTYPHIDCGTCFDEGTTEDFVDDALADI